MAGSFGYKREYYEGSESVGGHLRADLGETTGERLAAGGSSCSARLERLYDRPAPHPVELVAPVQK